jgi:methylated-DNA-[protein]-cysteine S-methyltransferase
VINFALFGTPIGRCGVAWRSSGVVGLALPDERDEHTRAFMLRRFPGASEGTPPTALLGALDDIVALLRGEPKPLDTITLDMDGVPDFHRRVYDIARTIPPGSTLSYGDIATRLGAPGSARAVGQALGKNPFPIVVPCHRVLAAGGKVGGFSAYGGTTTKLRLLEIEGVRIPVQRSLFDGDGKLGFDPIVAVDHLRHADEGLARLIDRVGPCRMQPKKTASIFAALSEAIVYQQLTGKAASTIYSRVCDLFPRAPQGITARHILEARTPVLRRAGLSRAKVLAIKDLARKVDTGKVPTLEALRSMDDAAVIERLTSVRGIGRWTVEMLLMFRLGRPDVLPLDDYGIQKGFSLTFRKRGLASKKDIEKRGKRWKPYRTVASWYLWRAVDLGKTDALTSRIGAR